MESDISTPFLRFNSYWKYDLRFEGRINDRGYEVRIDIQEEHQDIPLDRKVSLLELARCCPIRIYESDSAEDLDDISVSEDEYIPVCLSNKVIRFESSDSYIEGHLGYKSDLHRRIYTEEEINQEYDTDEFY